jgi:uncharacterized damage-inducible protein DinB
MSISELILPEFDEEMANTRKLLERVPEGRNDYKPHEKSMSLGKLASHVATLPEWGKHTFEVDVLEIQTDTPQFLANTHAELMAKFDEGVKEARALIAAASDKDFGETWTLKFGGKPIVAQSRYLVLRGMVLNHLIHHRAQLGVYIRLHDLEIPGMYGPSADEMKFWQPPTSQEASA